MFARFAVCASLLFPSTALAQGPSSDLVDALFTAARFDENLVILRAAAMADWRDTGESTLSAGDDPQWDHAILDGNDPAQITTDFRRGFLTVSFSQSDMEIAIAELRTF